MGTWGAGAFENDDAMDWVGDLSGATDFALIDSTLDAVLTPAEDAYIEAPESQSAIAAAETVAACVDGAAANLPDVVRDWAIANSAEVTSETFRKAWDAIVRVAKKSELQELWAEDPEVETEWNAAIFDLQERLAGTHLARDLGIIV